MPAPSVDPAVRILPFRDPTKWVYRRWDCKCGAWMKYQGEPSALEATLEGWARMHQGEGHAWDLTEKSGRSMPRLGDSLAPSSVRPY